MLSNNCFEQLFESIRTFFEEKLVPPTTALLKNRVPRAPDQFLEPHIYPSLSCTTAPKKWEEGGKPSQGQGRRQPKTGSPGRGQRTDDFFFFFSTDEATHFLFQMFFFPFFWDFD